MEITNFDLQDMDDSTVLQCVNPYDISPINGAETLYVALSEEKEVQQPPRVKLEMEEFSDLAPYLPKSTPKSSASFADELNTPIIEIKGPFEFMVHESINIQSPPVTDPFNKFEYETISSPTTTTTNSVTHNNKQLNDFSVYSNSNIELLAHHHQQEVNNMHEGSEVQIFQSHNTNDLEDYFLIHNNNTSEHNGNNNNIETPASTILTELLQQQDHQISASSLFKYEDNHSVVSVINDNQYSNISSTSLSNDDEYYATINQSQEQEEERNLGIVTPEDSNSSLSSAKPGPSSSSPRTYPKLKLDFGFSNSGNIHTPDVIDSVVSMENSFNILDYVSDKLVTTVNIEDIKFGTPSTSTPRSDETKSSSTVKGNKRKKRNYDDDDEEYFPPTKKASKTRRRGPAAVSPSVSTSRTSNESDEDDDDDDELFELKRGRPPRRRTSSFSSDHSGDVSKYRELRDKNNEASRKSRLKRKIKEQTLEKEMEELEEKNLKLSAQVEQLEKMVNNFRSNLFKIMLKK